MRKLFISADIEGVCGIADWKETELSSEEGAYFRAEMTREVAAVCEVALDEGVEEVLVKDAHDSGRNIDPSLLPENVKILRSWTKDPLVMMAGLDGSFDGACYIGYHSAGGTDGNPLAHTMTTNLIEIKVNGIRASEFLLNAWTSASLGVPSLLLSGDKALCETAAGLFPGIRTVAVSEGRGNASISINPGLARRRIAEAARSAIVEADRSKGPAVAVLPPSFEVEVSYRQHWQAYRASFYPGALRTGPLGAGFSAKDWYEVLRFLFFVL